jgi:HK97 family phage major capsid protein
MVIGLQVKALQEQKSALCDELDGANALCQAENRGPTADEQAKIDKLIADIESYGPQIERQEKIDAIMLARKQPEPTAPGTAVTPQQGTPEDDGATRLIIPATARRRNRLKAFKGPNAMEDAYTAGRFMGARLWRNPKDDQWCRDHGIQNAMSTNINTAGGNVVFPEFEATVIDLVEEYGVARQWCQNMPMGSDTLTVPTRDGGLTAYAVNENATITPSDMSWGAVELVARKWATLSKVSSELNEDSVISIADALAVEIARAFAQKEDDALFLGDGTATYHGIVGLVSALAAGCEAEAAGGNTRFSLLDLVDFEQAVGLIPMYPGIQPAWFISKPGFYASMSRLMTSAGGNTIPLVEGGANRPQFLGFPVVFNLSTVQSLAVQTDQTRICYFGDMGMSTMFGDRRGMTLDIDESLYFASDALAIRGTMRYDINVHSRGDASNPGAMVCITTNDA